MKNYQLKGFRGFSRKVSFCLHACGLELGLIRKTSKLSLYLEIHMYAEFSLHICMHKYSFVNKSYIFTLNISYLSVEKVSDIPLIHTDEATDQ